MFKFDLFRFKISEEEMDPAIEEGGTRKRKYVAEKGKAKKKKHLSTMVNAEKER